MESPTGHLIWFYGPARWVEVKPHSAPAMITRKPIFLDRDGVLNVNLTPYVFKRRGPGDSARHGGSSRRASTKRDSTPQSYPINRESRLGIAPPAALEAIDGGPERVAPARAGRIDTAPLLEFGGKVLAGSRLRGAPLKARDEST